MPRKRRDLTSQQFGDWLVLEEASKLNNSKDRRLLCRCRCGTEKSVKIGSLTSGKSKSCGCPVSRQGEPNAVSRLCPQCKETKTREYFGQDKKRRDGLKYWCKVCDRQRSTRDYWRTKERRTAKRHSPEMKEWHRAYNLKRFYDMSLEQYQSILSLQGFRCAICRAEEPRGSKRQKYFHVDHDHSTGVVRGLLCVVCNTRLGVYEQMSKDNRVHHYLALQIAQKVLLGMEEE